MPLLWSLYLQKCSFSLFSKIFTNDNNHLIHKTFHSNQSKILATLNGQTFKTNTMKTANLTFMFFLLGWATMFAQIQKGTIYLAPVQLRAGAFGTADDKLSANVQGDHGTYTYTFALLPTYGYALTDHLTLWGAAKLANTSVSSTSFTQMDAQLNARFYVNPAAKNNHLFAEAGGRTYLEFENDNKPLWGYQAMIGLTHFIDPGVALELSAGHQQMEKQGNFVVNSGFAIYLNRQSDPEQDLETPIQKGTFVLGNGLLNLNFLADDNRVMALSPHLSYFLSNRFSAGLSLNYQNVNLGEGDFRVANWVIEPQFRYYLMAKNRAGIYASMGGGANITQMSFNESNSTSSDYFYGAGLGVDAFISRRVALEFGPNLRHYPELKLIRVGLDMGVRMFL